MTPLAAYVLLFLAVGIGFIAVHLFAGKLVRPNRPNAEKGTVYECGEPTIGSAWVQFDLRFYVVALLFVIFDVEVAFFFPWAEVFGKANAVANAPLPDPESPQPTDARTYRQFAAAALDLADPWARQVDETRPPRGLEATPQREARMYKTMAKLSDEELEAYRRLTGPGWSAKLSMLRHFNAEFYYAVQQLGEKELAAIRSQAARLTRKEKVDEQLPEAVQAGVVQAVSGLDARAVAAFKANLTPGLLRQVASMSADDVQAIRGIQHATLRAIRDDLPKKTQAAASELAWLALIEILVFFGVLLVGFAYLWRRGDLAWVRSTAAERQEQARQQPNGAAAASGATLQPTGASGHA